MMPIRNVTMRRLHIAIANAAPLAKITTLKRLDVTDCARVTDRDRRAFTANEQLTVVPEK